MTKIELLALAERLDGPYDASTAQAMMKAANILRKIAVLLPVAWLSIDCIGERYLCFTKSNDLDPVEPLFNLTGTLDE